MQLVIKTTTFTLTAAIIAFIVAFVCLVNGSLLTALGFYLSSAAHGVAYLCFKTPNREG